MKACYKILHNFLSPKCLWQIELAQFVNGRYKTKFYPSVCVKSMLKTYFWGGSGSVRFGAWILSHYCSFNQQVCIQNIACLNCAIFFYLFNMPSTQNSSRIYSSEFKLSLSVSSCNLIDAFVIIITNYIIIYKC